jgi:hypothetical protein
MNTAQRNITFLFYDNVPTVDVTYVIVTIVCYLLCHMRPQYLVSHLAMRCKMI